MEYMKQGESTVPSNVEPAKAKYKYNLVKMVTTPGGNTYPPTPPMTRKCSPATGTARPTMST
jgi:hypothetical protein